MGGCDPILDGVAGGGCNIFEEVVLNNRRCFVSDEDFLGNLSTNLSTQEGYNIVNGGGYSVARQAPAAGDTEHFGIIRSTLAPASVGGFYRQAFESIGADCLGSNNRLAWACRFALQGVAPSATEDYFASFGIEAQAGGAPESSDGIYFYLDQSNANWQAKVARAGARTSLDCGVGFDTNWHTAAFITSSDALSVEIHFDGALVGTITPPNLNPAIGIASTVNHLTILGGGITVNAVIDCDRVVWGVLYQ